uniref:Uncharacterized protein n=1 Tax=viral metagenome TaxID=1070528 RepID=A0A6M3LQT9_9ZZZZ
MKSKPVNFIIYPDIYPDPHPEETLQELIERAWQAWIEYQKEINQKEITKEST